MGTTNLTVTAKGASTVTLPVAVSLVKDLPAKLTLTPALPELRGNSRSTFEYQLTIKNESGKRIVANLAATAPPNFEVSFTEQYGSQELNAVPLDANQSKDVKLKVRPPNTIGVGPQKIVARATAEDTTVTADLGMEITGTPKIETVRQGWTAQRRRPRPGRRPRSPSPSTNTGTSAAEAVEMSGSAPGGWKVEADPKTIDRIPPNENKEVIVQDHADRQGGGRRLRYQRPRQRARRVRLADLPRCGRDLDAVGPDRHGHHRHRAAGDVRRRDEVRAPMSQNVIEAQNLTKRYDGVPVVKGISFSVAQGEIFGLLGPNGAGKTTTILMMLGLTEVSDGQVRVLGYDPVREPLQVKRRVGYLPDAVGFYDNLTAAENLRYTGRLIGLDRQ